MKIFNMLSRKKEEFEPIKKGEVSMYTCGPTVYNYPHIGNYRAYMAADLLRRYFEYKGIKVKQVMNITDVDDKTIRDSQKQGKTLKVFTEFYTKGFFEDLEKLNIEQAFFYPRATGHIKEMVEIIKVLIKKGYAYKGEDGCIYFDVRKFKDYGKLAHIKLEELEEGASGRVKKDEYEKEQANDFALWKAWDKEDGEVYWETDIGKGRPGWHIECSAMSMKYLGKTFDIHTGGIDLVFPHHQNEIAQSEAANGVKFVNYWVHNEWLLVEGKKMSKSLGNFYSLRDILDKGYSPLAVRYVLLATHYRQQLNFTFKALEAAQASIDRLQEFIDKLLEIKAGKDNKEIESLIETAKTSFEKSLDDDLEISGALGAIFDFVRDVNKVMDNMSESDAKRVIEFMKDVNNVLQILSFEKKEVPTEIKAMIELREEARKQKDFTKADKIRDELKEKGYVVKDTPQGPRAEKI